MITRFTVHCRSFVWYLIIAFTICSIPHFELVPAELAGLLSDEAYAAQACSTASCPTREYVYDAQGRMVTERQLLENGGISETYYSYSGFSTTKTDPDKCVKTETRDYLGRIVRAEETFEGRVLRIAYAYNAANDLLSMTDPQGSVTAMAYDNLGRRVSLADSHTGTWNYAYDGNGNLVKQTDPAGHSVKEKKVGISVEISALDEHIIIAIAIAAAGAIMFIVGIILGDIVVPAFAKSIEAASKFLLVAGVVGTIELEELNFFVYIIFRM
jgi:YD repeat-containing protein